MPSTATAAPQGLANEKCGPDFVFGYTRCGVSIQDKCLMSANQKTATRNRKATVVCEILPSAKPCSPFGDTVNADVSAEERFSLAMIDTIRPRTYD